MTPGWWIGPSLLLGIAAWWQIIATGLRFLPAIVAASCIGLYAAHLTTTAIAKAAHDVGAAQEWRD